MTLTPTCPIRIFLILTSLMGRETTNMSKGHTCSYNLSLDVKGNNREFFLSFATVTASTHQGTLYTIWWTIAVRGWLCSATAALVMSGTGVGWPVLVHKSHFSSSHGFVWSSIITENTFSPFPVHWQCLSVEVIPFLCEQMNTCVSKRSLKDLN